MDLSTLLTADRIRVPLQSVDKASVLRELAAVAAGGAGAFADSIEKAVLEREAVLSTGIGFGVAIPHGRIPTVGDLTVAAGLSATPIPFDALDGEPVRIFFLLVGPERAAGLHVKALSRIARLARSETLRARLLAADTAQQFLQALEAAEAW